MDRIERNKSILGKYIPEKAIEPIVNWIYIYNFKLKIKKARTTKYGDYRPPFDGKNHQITINHDLNRYAFLVTLVHEIAHLSAWKKHGDKIDSHGIEWKNEFRGHLKPFLNETIFPNDVMVALLNYISNPSATVCNDVRLFKTLHKYNKPDDYSKYLDEIPINSVFEASNKQQYIKHKKLRTRYLCREVATSKEYFFHALAKVKPVIKKEKLPELFE